MSDEELDRWIDGLAQRVVSLRMESAVEFFLESHLPATTLLHNIGLFAQPLVTPFFGAERLESMQKLLSDRAQVEKLQQAIRTKAEQRK